MFIAMGHCIRLIVYLLVIFGVVTSASGYRVVTTGTERVATPDPAQSQPAALEHAVHTNRLDGVIGTGWFEATARRKNRADQHLVPANQDDENSAHRAVTFRSSRSTM